MVIGTSFTSFFFFGCGGGGGGGVGGGCMLVCIAAESERTEFLFTKSRYSTLGKKSCLFFGFLIHPSGQAIQNKMSTDSQKYNVVILLPLFRDSSLTQGRDH